MMKTGRCGMLGRSLAILAVAFVASAAQAVPVVTGAFNPPQVPGNTQSTLTLSYAGFTSDSVGMVLRLYFDSTKVTPGTPVYSNPPGSSQPAGPVTAGVLAGCTGADSFFTLNWVDFGAAWPNPTSGTLATVPFTTNANFASNTTVCFVDDTSQGAPVRNISGNAQLQAPPPTATIAVSPSSVADNGSALTFTVTVAPAPGAPISVNVTSGVTGTMTGVTNNCGSSVNVNAAGTGTCTISATNTVPFDGPGTATVTVVAGTGYVVGGANFSASGTITNDDLPTVNVSASPTNLVDSAGQVSTVTVSIGVNAPAGGFTVPLTTTVQDATRATTTCTNQIIIAAGSSSNTCTVTATPNTTANDGSKTVTVAPNCSGTCVNGTTATVNINDDDIPTITVAASPNPITDSAGQVSTITFSTAITSATPLQINFTGPAASGRYTAADCTSPLTLPANTSSVTCHVTATANTNVADGSASAVIQVQAGTGYSVGNPAQVTVNVNDDDKATITITASPTTLAENSGASSTFTITATAPAGGVLTNGQSVSVVLSGTGTGSTGRYNSTCSSPQVVNFTGALTAMKTCMITPIDNNVVDGDVTATVTISADAAYTVGSPSSAQLLIQDDEHGVTVTAAAASITEGQPAVFNISCGGASGSVQVNYTITGADPGVTITPSASTITLACPTGGTVTVPTVDDTIIGNTRQVTLTITGIGQAPAGTVVGTPNGATVTVFDNDKPLVIPTMSGLGLLMLVLSLAGMAGFAVRRKT